MLEEAVKASKETAKKYNVQPPLVIGVTYLTSDSNVTQQFVLDKAILAKQAGLDGVVASGKEVVCIRQELGEEFVIVTPGIRPAGEAAGDQQRIVTPSEAVKNGSDYLVVGRPIVKADQPLVAAKKILDEMKGG